MATDTVNTLNTVITVTVQDDNDNIPTFDRQFYDFVIPHASTHNIKTSKTYLDDRPKYVGKVHALDRDAAGPNSALTYSLAAGASDYFSVDEISGGIFTRKELTYYRTSNLDSSSSENTYRLRIVATDGGSPPMSSECEVKVTLVRENIYSPRFENSNDSEIAVPKSVSVGSLLFTLNATDEESDKIKFSLKDGKHSKYFVVDPNLGNINIIKPLDDFEEGSEITIEIIADDDGSPVLQTSTTIKVLITGDNLYPPTFQAPTTRIYIREDEQIGTEIITVRATDRDAGVNGYVTYHIVSDTDPEEMFSIDKTSGSIHVEKSLDYEKIPIYNIIVEARDQGFIYKSSTSSVKVILQDVDDNPPTFEEDHYVAYLKENSPAGTVVTQMIGHDEDSEKNSQIEYHLMDSELGKFFEVDKVSGLVTSLVTFDYEQMDRLDLKIVASSPMNPGENYNAETILTVHIEGENEYYPKFRQPIFRFDISEAAQMGGVVGFVEAIDNDKGEDGEVFYYFVGSSNNAGFIIDHKTGEISVKDRLDREAQNRYVLTILAKNRGSIRGNDTDEAQVDIQVLDGNDPPVFHKSEYTADISEDALVGKTVLTVSAVDEDVKPRNSHFSYSIHWKKTPFHGEDDSDIYSRNTPKPLVPFTIGSSSGIVSVSGKLDREKVPYYDLIIRATDLGVPPAVGTTQLKISITDVNDSPPELTESNRKGFVKENSPPRSRIMQLKASDPDILSSKDGPEFLYYLVQGRDAGLLDLDRRTGILRTKATIDREQHPNGLEATVEVQDSGNPPLSARYDLLIDVIDENDNPSQDRRVDVIIKNYEGTFPGGQIMTVRPSDPDISGDYTCKLEKGPENIFSVRQNCTVTAGRIQNGREYQLKIISNDGKHSDVEVNARLNFVGFSHFAVTESVCVRFSKARPEEVLSFFKDLTQIEENKVLELLSLKTINLTAKNRRSQDSIVDVFLASREGDSFLPKTDTLEHLRHITSTSGGFTNPNSIFGDPANVIYDYDPCTTSNTNGLNTNGPCQNGGKCSSRTLVQQETHITESEDTIFNSPILFQNVTCECLEEFSGEYCQLQKNPCVPNPCLERGQCLSIGRSSFLSGNQGDESSGFQCLCPSLRGGKRCEIEKSNNCLPNPCLNGGSCQNTEQSNKGNGKLFQGFFCLCRTGYQGDLCQMAIDPCRENPCLNGGTCISLKPSFRCECPDHYYGSKCEDSTFGFDELSYVTFPPLDSTTNDIAIIFATTKPNSLLVWNFGARSVGGRSDFFALELVGGKPRLSWGGARTNIAQLQLDRKVNTGRLYKVTATRNNRVGSLTVEDCTESGEYCKPCQTDDARCFTKVVGTASSGTLVFKKNPMYFGGVGPDIQHVLDRPGQLSSVDFIGCVKSISINGNERSLFSESLNRTGLKRTCNRQVLTSNPDGRPRAGAGGPCSRGDECGITGTCIPRWSHHQCICGENEIIAPDCGMSFQPFTLTEKQEVHFIPTEKYRRALKLATLTPSKQLGRWKREVNQVGNGWDGEKEVIDSLALSFRTFGLHSTLLSIQSRGPHIAFTKLEVVDGVLVYKSQGLGKPEINMTTDINISDGAWHAVKLQVLTTSDLHRNKVLQVYLDGSRVGYEVEFSAAHNFLDPSIEKLIIGDAKHSSQGFRGCIANFTLNNHLQTIQQSLSSNRYLQLLEANTPAGLQINGCDVEILSSLTGLNGHGPVDVGVTVVIVFFVVILLLLAGSFTYYKLRSRYKTKGKERTSHNASQDTSINKDLGISNRGLDITDERNMQQQLNNSRVPLNPPTTSPHHFHKKQPHHQQQQPDLIGLRSGVPGGGVFSSSPPPQHPQLPSSGASNFPLSHGHQHSNLDPDPPSMYSHEPAEHYDIDNASSIAPSDIDIVYHYKGYRDGGNHHRNYGGGHRSLPKKKRNGGGGLMNHPHNQTPLARLSPSSEISHNTPRILTLGDLSGKPLPPNLLSEQGRGLGSPISHVSSDRRSHGMNQDGRRSAGHLSQHQSRNSPRGLTSENVAR